MTKAEFFRDARNDLSGPLAGVRVVEATTTARWTNLRGNTGRPRS